MSGFNDLKNNGVDGIKITATYVGYSINLSEILTNEELKVMSQKDFEKKLNDYFAKLTPKMNISINSI